MDFIEKYQGIFESTKKLKTGMESFLTLTLPGGGSCYSDGVRTLKTPQRYRWGGVLLMGRAMQEKKVYYCQKKEYDYLCCDGSRKV